VTFATVPRVWIGALKRVETVLRRLRHGPSFAPAVEQRYEAFSVESRNRALRFWLLFGLIFRVLGLSSEVAIGGDMPVYGLAFRLGLLVPVVLVSLAFLSPRYSLRTQGLAATVAPFLCVVGITLLGTVAPPSDEVRYFFLGGVNIIAINLVMPLRFRHAVAYTAASILAYLLISLSGLGGLEFREVADIVFLYSLAAVASLAVTYRNDVADRRAFLASERISSQAAALARANEELQRLLATDALTGVYNRRYLDQSIRKSGETAIAEHAHLGMIMVDVDHFKAFNDMRGHSAGDECLRAVAQAITANVREGTDIVTRYGGEEFAVLVPGLSPEDTLALGERIRAAIEALAIPHPRARGAKVTVSVGTSGVIPDGVAALEALMEKADGALYRSKHLGRNLVTSVPVPVSAALDGIKRPAEEKSAA
jgi:diguanylate cyclase (GGDEF)-like protein